MLVNDNFYLPLSIEDNDYGLVSLDDVVGNNMATGSDEEMKAMKIALESHDKMAVKLSEFRAFFEGIIEHAPSDSPVESLEIYRGFIDQIDEVLS